jgi:capsular polysaccharide transport system permease protein
MMSDKTPMAQFTNEERIRQWRNRQGAAAPCAPDVASPAIPSRREEELDAAEALRIENAERRIPSEADIDDAIATTRRQHWSASIAQRRHALRIVGIPLLCVLLYGLILAPSSKAVDSSFVVLHAGEARDPSQIAGLIGAGGAEGLADAYRIREYLLSREAMAAMEQRHGFLTHFRKGTRDPFSRPTDLSSVGIDSYGFYRRKIDIAIDVREGIVRLNVGALTPEDSRRFAIGLLALARERIKAISDMLNADQIASFDQDVRRAESDMRKASDELANAQRRQHVLDPQAAATTTYQLIASLEVTLVGRQAQRDSILANGMTESPLLARIDAEIASIRRQTEAVRSRLAGGAGSGSLAEASTDLGPANTRLRLSQLGLEASLRTLEQANLNTISQRRYLVVISNPILPYETWQSRILELLGLTLIGSLLVWGAASILRSSSQLTGRR